MLIEEVELIQEIATIDLFQLYNFRSFIDGTTCWGAGGRRSRITALGNSRRVILLIVTMRYEWDGWDKNQEI